MVLVPSLSNYSIEKLIVLGNFSTDAFAREDIKNIIVDKILELNNPMFYLLSKYMHANKILKEAYAKVILIRLTNEVFNIDDNIIDEILQLISLEDLARYGADVRSLEIRKKCESLFWVNALIFEDASELNKKNAIYRRRVLIEKIKSGR